MQPPLFIVRLASFSMSCNFCLEENFQKSSTFPSEILRKTFRNHLEKFRKSRQLLEEITAIFLEDFRLKIKAF